MTPEWRILVNNSRPKAKLSRALGIPLTRKCVKYFERRPFPPGVHGRGRRKSLGLPGPAAGEAAPAPPVQHQRGPDAPAFDDAAPQARARPARPWSRCWSAASTRPCCAPASPAPSTRPASSSRTATSPSTARRSTARRYRLKPGQVVEVRETQPARSRRSRSPPPARTSTARPRRTCRRSLEELRTTRDPRAAAHRDPGASATSSSSSSSTPADRRRRCDSRALSRRNRGTIAQIARSGQRVCSSQAA